MEREGRHDPQATPRKLARACRRAADTYQGHPAYGRIRYPGDTGYLVTLVDGLIARAERIERTGSCT